MLSIIGLVLLLLLSPCKVRNFIQSELGSPQTKVLNKSQSTINHRNCQQIEVDETNQKISKPTLIDSKLLAKVHYKLKGLNRFEKEVDFTPSIKKHVDLNVPLYILYQNLNLYW